MNKQSRWKIILPAIFLLLAVVLMWSGESSARTLLLQQTWPTRTPTPPSNPPTQPPPSGQPTTDPGNGSEVPTDATATVVGIETPIALAPTPIGGYLPTAEPCSAPPTVLALAGVNVREGPGLDYDITAYLVYLEVRPIIARAADAAWWLIQLPDDSTGWVFDQAVVVNGYIGNVPTTAAPPLDGETPTPGVPWEPTPNPACTPLPTNTPTTVPSPTPVSTRVSQVVTEDTATTEPPTRASSPTAVEITPTHTSVPTETPSPQPSPTARASAATESNEESPESEPAEEVSFPGEDQGSSGVSWLLVGGLALMAAAVVVWLVRRR